MGAPQNGCFVMENSIKIDDLGVPPISGNLHMARNGVFPQPLILYIERPTITPPLQTGLGIDVPFWGF